MSASVPISNLSQVTSALVMVTPDPTIGSSRVKDALDQPRSFMVDIYECFITLR